MPWKPKVEGEAKDAAAESTEASKKSDSKQSKGKGKSKDSSKGESKKGESKGQDKGKGKGKSKGQGKDQGKDQSWNTQLWSGAQSWNPPSQTELYKRQLRARASEILRSKTEGVCGGHLSQLLQEADKDAVMAVYGQKGEVQRGWLQALMRNHPEVECDRNARGRDHMYTLKESARSSPSQAASLVASQMYAAMYQRMASAKAASMMAADDFIGNWLDSLGNQVTVMKNAHDDQLTAVLKRPPRKDIILALYQKTLANGWPSWQCGNSVLQVPQSSSQQLCWMANMGQMSIWMKNASEAAAQAPASTEETSKEAEATDAAKAEEPKASD